jgi:hypothetical protein
LATINITYYQQFPSPPSLMRAYLETQHTIKTGLSVAGIHTFISRAAGKVSFVVWLVLLPFQESLYIYLCFFLSFSYLLGNNQLFDADC